MRDRFGTIAALLGLLALLGALVFSRMESTELKGDLKAARDKAETALVVTEDLKQQISDLKAAIFALTLEFGDATYTCVDPENDGTYGCVADDPDAE